MRLQSFEQAFAAANADRKKLRPVHVLLGNGFSRAWKDNIFAYGALFDRADFRALSPHVRDAFVALRTRDFEKMMRALKDAANLIQVYEPAGRAISTALMDDATGLREVLVRAIADSHPNLPDEIRREAYVACRRFLGRFDRIVTLNYDLLLYWALMQREIEPQIACDDGFRRPDREADYVTWEPDNTHNQNVYYLHGALHLFDSGTEVQKYTWVNTRIKLIDQIRDALQRDMFPLFVAEGESAEKVERIRHNAYLAKAERSVLSLGGTMFVFGHSLAASDDHVLSMLVRSKIDRLYISVHGDPESTTNREIMKRGKALEIDHEFKQLKVDFYEAASAQVWG